MKVHISYTIEVPDEIRRQINAWYGQPGLADRAAIRAWYRSNGESMDDDLATLAGEDADLDSGTARNCEECGEDYFTSRTYRHPRLCEDCAAELSESSTASG